MTSAQQTVNYRQELRALHDAIHEAFLTANRILDQAADPDTGDGDTPQWREIYPVFLTIHAAGLAVTEAINRASADG